MTVVPKQFPEAFNPTSNCCCCCNNHEVTTTPILLQGREEKEEDKIKIPSRCVSVWGSLSLFFLCK